MTSSDPAHSRSSLRRAVVVGGGVAGLSAAWELSGVPGVEVTVLEGAPGLGGKLRTAEVAGIGVDVGAEAVLARRPEAVDLMREVAPDEPVQHPARAGASVLHAGGLAPMPTRTLMGVPADPLDPAGLAALVGAQAARRTDDRGRAWAPLEGDVAVGRLLRERLGDAVVDALVEPLLGGVYAGDPDALSLRATVPALWPAVARGESLTEAVARVMPAAPRKGSEPAPVFAGLTGGVGRLPGLVADAAARRGVLVRTGAVVRALERGPDGRGWRLTVGPTRTPEVIEADDVVLAVPAAPAGRLLAGLAPDAATTLGRVRYASMAVVTLALPGRAVAEAIGGSGYLVPRAEGRRRGWDVKGVTASSTKWPWLGRRAADRGLTLLRGSIGRVGEEHALHRDDADLVATLRRELGSAVGVEVPAPVDAHVQRWGGGLPQYPVGHLEDVERVRASVARLPGLALAGAAYDGVGVPACIASGRAAARSLHESA